MKYSSIILVGLGLLGGVIIGYCVNGRFHSESLYPILPDPPPKHASTYGVSMHEQELLRETMKQLDRISAELEDSKASIQQLKPKAARYEKTKELWIKSGFGSSTPLIYKHEGLIPSDALIEYFEWNAATVDAINKIGKTTERSILEWEAQSANCIENTLERYVFEIPKAPPEIREQYKTSLEEIIGKEDTDLVILEANRKLDQYLFRKTVAFSRVSEPTASGQENTIFGFNESGQNTASSKDVIDIEIKGYRRIDNIDAYEYGNDVLFFTSSGKMPYNPNTPTYDRWNHLLGRDPF